MRFNGGHVAGLEPGPFGGVIVVRDYGRPIRARHAGPCGPTYYSGIRRAETAEGVMGYLLQAGGASGALVIGEGGPALRVLSGSAFDLAGHYSDGYAYGDGDTVRPYVAVLPHRRGYLAGWGYGPGMLCGFSRDIWPEAPDAAREAHREAERQAERDAWDADEWRAQQAAQDAAERRAAEREAAEARRAARAEARRAAKARRLRPHVRRIVRRMAALMAERADGRSYQAGLDLEERLRELQKPGGRWDGPVISNDRSGLGWAAYYLGAAAEIRREYREKGGGWRLSYALGYVASAAKSRRWARALETGRALGPVVQQ